MSAELRTAILPQTAAEPDERAGDGGRDEAAAWAALTSAESAQEFCSAWLALQCRSVGGVVAGLLVIADGPRSYAPAAIWPDANRDLAALASCAQRALTARRGLVVRHGDDAGTAGLGANVAYPIEAGGRLWGVVVLETRARAEADLQAALRALHWGAGWIEALFHRGEAHARDALRADAALAQKLAVAAGTRGLRPLCLAAAALLATDLDCRRVAIGVVRAGRIELTAISHVAWFTRRNELVAGLQTVMEEAFDARHPLSHPPLPDSPIAIASAGHARATGMATLLAVPIEADGRVVAVLTLERDKPTPTSDTQALIGRARSAAIQLGPVLALAVDSDRMLSGRIARATTGTLHAVFGPRRPAAKLAALALVAVLATLTFATSTWRVSAKATLEGAIQRAAVAPFEGYIATAPARAGDLVRKGQLLATLDDRELALEALRRESERDQSRLKQRDAEGRHERAEAAVNAAAAGEAEAQLALVQEKLARARITAPFDAVVVSGDLSHMLNAPVERGKVLFELAPLDAYRVILQVDERDVAALAPGQRGRLLLSGRSSHPLDITVRRLTAVATAADGRNAFRVEATLDEPAIWLRPGMEGIGKVIAGEGRALWVYGHPLLDWARMQWFKLAP